ncbi:MAG: glycosyltransferase [Bacteroidia bacterium]|nr:glycosyltransferase [Bacteroidia bacterium]
MLNLLPKGKLKIIIAPLNWGLGHASRCLAITEKLLEGGHEIIFASDGDALELLSRNHPDKNFYELPGYGLKYRNSNELFSLLDNLPGILKAVIQEKGHAEKLSAKLKPDVIISDSRFGFRSKSCLSVIVSHQLNLQTKYSFTRWAGNIVNKFWIRKFDQCWVPDFDDSPLSGKLSYGHPFIHVHYIGPLSNFKRNENSKNTIDLLISLSGPEPARSIFEERLIHYFRHFEGRVVLVRGSSRKTKTNMPQHWEVFDLIDRKEMNKIVCQAKKIISRSGYSSIMDFFTVGKSAQIVPTEGQAEQEYLARTLNGKYGFSCKLESDFK